MHKRIPVQSYQMIMLEHAFFKYDINIEKISSFMEDILPKKYFLDDKKEILTSESFKKEIYLGGSLAFESLIDSLETQKCLEEEQNNIVEIENFHRILKILQDRISENIKPMYRYIWLWSTDQHETHKRGDIMRVGKSWFTDKKNCIKEAIPPLNHTDLYLGIESVCPCLIHKSESYVDFYELPCECKGHLIDNIIAPPCRCFRVGVPDSLKYIQEAQIEGETIIRTGTRYTYASPVEHEYIIKETKEMFLSQEEELYFAFIERKREKIADTIKEPLHEKNKNKADVKNHSIYITRKDCGWTDFAEMD